MFKSHPSATRRPSWAVAMLILVSLAAAAPASADPVLGFRETFPGTTIAGWGGNLLVDNPGSGGTGGAGDGFLRLSTVGQLQLHLGTVSFGAEYAGNWQAAGITKVRLALNDVNGDDPLEMHFAIGNGLSFWEYDPAFIPPEHAWGYFTVDLTTPGNWTQTIGVPTDPFFSALQEVDRIHIRHDRAPYVQRPDDLEGDFGLDNILLTDGIVGVPPGEAIAGGPVELAAPYPNPSHGPVALSFRSFDGGPVRVQILDVGGRSVRRVELPATSAGARTWMWDGRDDSGRPVPAGSYRVRAIGSAGGTSRPLVRIN